jgi:hypothetical protein
MSMREKSLKPKKTAKPKKLVNEDEEDSQDSTSDSSSTPSLSSGDLNIINKNNVIKDRLNTIDKILNMYPSLKIDRSSIVNTVLDKQEKVYSDYVLEKLVLNNKKDKIYYKDKNGNILDEHVNLAGFSVSENSKETLIFFDDSKKRHELSLQQMKKFEKLINNK